MLGALTTQGIEGFYQRWSPLALAFARHLFGDERQAELALEQAFQGYVERELPLDEPGTPAFLFVFVLDRARRDATERIPTTNNATLPEALLGLPLLERAVFILRSVMDWDEWLVGEIVELPIQEVRRRWLEALKRLRALMH